MKGIGPSTSSSLVRPAHFMVAEVCKKNKKKVVIIPMAVAKDIANVDHKKAIKGVNK